jgi:ParB family chromosome partitioning protein
VSAQGEPQRLELLPTATPEVRRATLHVEQLAGFENARPGRTLIELIRRLGVLEPIIVAPAPHGRYLVVEGRRRAKSVQLLAAEADTEAQIPAVIVTGTSSERSAVLAGLALALHAGRSESPSSELQAIETILEADRLSGERTTVSAIAAQTGMSTQTIRRRLKLRRLSPTLRAAFDQGEITTTAAEAAARLTPDQQAQLEQTLAHTSRLPVDAVGRRHAPGRVKRSSSYPARCSPRRRRRGNPPSAGTCRQRSTPYP